ncbi:MAG: single-stranded DNA-binding protein [Oscillospiraceae bacterium]|jgi:single-strand DNA-binding protein|nr:single-stranded DNA-binding protein [Oscillospiraceae bacterium]
MYSKAIIMGRLTADPELRQTPANVTVTGFRVAVQRPFVNKGGERLTDFFAVVAWGKHAEFVAKHFKKGNMILVDGRLESREYVDKNGMNQRIFEIIAENVSFCGEPKPGTGAGAAKPASFETSDFKELDDEDLPF